MKLDERTAIPIPREGKRDNVDQSVNFDNQDRSSEGHHNHKLSQHFNLSKSPPRFDADQSDQSSRYTHIPSRSAPALTAQTTDDYYFNKQDPISIEGIPLNEREKKWWNELRETAGKLADFASFVHRTGKIPPRNDLEWARSNFHLFAENMSALQMVLGVLRGEGPRFPDAGLNTLKMANSSRYGKRLMSQSPSLEGGSSKTLSTTFPPPLNRHVSYDKVILPDRSMRPSTSLTALTGDRSDVPYNKTTPSTYDQRYIQRLETGSERLDIEHNRWRERSAESNRTKEAGRLDMLPETNFARDRTSSSNARTFAAPPTDEQDYSSEKVGSSRVGSTAPLPPPPLTSPYGNYPRHLNNSPRSGFSAHERPRVSETDGFVQRASMPSQHHINNPVGLPVPQPPLHNPRQTFAERRASSDFEGTQHPTTYSPPYNSKSDDRYGYRPPSDHFSTQHGSRFPNDHYRDEYREGNQYDHSYVSGDESGSGSVGFRPSKYRKRSRAPAPGSCVSCGVRDTPEWRRGPNGARTLCNACGLHFSKLLRRKKQEQGNDSATVSVEELRSSLKLPGNGSTGQISPSF